MGYVYQRRWGAFWIGALAAMAAGLTLGAVSAVTTKNQMAEQPGAVHEQMYEQPTIVFAFSLGLYAGLFAVGIGSAVEAGLAVKRARRRLGR